MVIEKIINNNVVIVAGDDGKETVVMGKGIGFQMKAGQCVDEQKIEKRFVLDSKSDMGRFGELVQSIPIEHFEVCIKIIDPFSVLVNKFFNAKSYPLSLSGT